MIRPVLYCAICILLIGGIFRSIRLAWADYGSAQPDPASVASACRLEPGSARSWLKVSELWAIDSPEDPAVDEAISRALEANPRYTEAWMARALRADMHGRTGQAEQDYLRAASVDHMYKPAWALANFYILHNDAQRFWIYGRKCLEVVEPRTLEPASYNPAPLFDLAWRTSENAAEIRRNLIPRRHFILADYLQYLNDHDLLEAGAEVAGDLAGYGDAQDLNSLVSFCDRLIEAPRPKAAVELWNAMVAGGILRTERLNPAAGLSLTNGDLRHVPAPAGFDWRMPPAEGITQSHFREAGEVRLEFSGDEPEGVLPLMQSVPVLPGGSYRLAFRYRTRDMDHLDGLTWQVWDYAGRRPLPSSCRLAPHPEWSEGEARFTVPKGVGLVRLAVDYRRAPGSTRISGLASFRNFRLELQRRSSGDRRG